MATPQEAAPDLSVLLINLLKSVLYRDTDEQLWGTLLQLQALVRDYVMVLNLELVLDEAEGYAFLKSKPEPDEGSTAAPLPRLVARRQLSFPVSLLLALLRKRLAEFDAGAGDTRLVLSRDDMVDLIRVFLADSPNEVKLIDQIEATINKVVDLGFLRKLKQPGGTGLASYEVRRILKAFVDAQWLADFDTRLGQYQQHLNTTPATNEGQTDE
jgi:hypothetical protein